MVAIRDILGEDPQPIDYDRVPWCIYCHPEVAFAGYSEEAAKEAGSTWSCPSTASAATAGP
jgi:dihydrolipoamide dehydrogenase